MFLRVLVFYLATLVFSGVLNAVQAAAGPDPALIQLVQFAPALGVGVMFLLFRRTTRVDAEVNPAAVGRSAMTVGTAAHAAVNLSLILLFAEETGAVFPMAVLAVVWTVAAVAVSSVKVRGAVEVEDGSARPARVG